MPGDVEAPPPSVRSFLVELRARAQIATAAIVVTGSLGVGLGFYKLVTADTPSEVRSAVETMTAGALSTAAVAYVFRKDVRLPS